MNREPTIPTEIAPRTGDFAFVQALAETCRTARRAGEAGGDDRWRSIADDAERILAAIGVDSPEAGHRPAIGFDRIDRGALGLDADEAARVASVLRAVGDRPGPRQLDAAREALSDLAGRTA